MYQQANFNRSFNRLFNSSSSAKQAGYFSASVWKKHKRKIIEGSFPSLVCLKSGFILGKPTENELVIEILEDRYRVPAPGIQNFWFVYNIDQTEEIKPKKRKSKNKKTKNELCRFYIPEDLNLTDIPNEIRDGVLWCCNHIHRSSIQWQQDDAGYIHIHSRIANQITGKDWSKIRDWMLENQVIETDGYYIRHEKAYGYKFAPGYEKVRLLKYDSPSILKKMKKVKRKLQPVHQALEGMFTSLEIDEQKAADLLPKIYAEYIEETEEHNKWQRQFDKKQKSIESREVYENRVKGLIDLLVSKDAEIGICDYGRLHSPITRLPQDLRDCLTAQGQKLIEIDVANSQPLIAGLLAQKFCSNRKAKYRLLAKTFENENPYLKSRRELATLEKYLHEIIGGETPNNMPADLQHYLKVCQEGKFYETIKLEIKKDVSRKRIKRECLSYFYDTPARAYRYKYVAPAIKSLFPTIDNMLTEIKSKSKSLASHILQNWEATIFIDSACSELVTLPNCFVFTLHDGLLITEQHKEQAIETIKKSFARFDCKPTIRTKVNNSAFEESKNEFQIR